MVNNCEVDLEQVNSSDVPWALLAWCPDILDIHKYLVTILKPQTRFFT